MFVPPIWLFTGGDRRHYGSAPPPDLRWLWVLLLVGGPCLAIITLGGMPSGSGEYISRHERNRIARINANVAVEYVAGPVNRESRQGVRYLPLYVVRDTKGRLLVTDVPGAIGTHSTLSGDRLGFHPHDYHLK